MSMVDPLLPLAEEALGAEPVERRISQLFGAVPAPLPLPELARQRIALRLRPSASRAPGLLLVRLVVVGVVIGMAGAAAAQWAVTRIWGPQPEQAPLPPHGRASEAPLISTPPSPPAARLRAEPVAEDAPPPEQQVTSPPPASSPAASSRLGLEAASLQAGVSALRAGGAARAEQALAAIDRHLRAFPGGALELEARVARIDALLLLGRRQEARRELSALPIERAGRSRELRLIRAELRADDDCAAALPDFQVLVEQSLPEAWAERALFGRGACLLRLGDGAGARRDFARYLERFPSGRFAEQVRAQRR